MSAARVDLVVRGGKVVTASEVTETAVAVRGEQIVALGPPELLPPAERYIDATGKYVLPGLIDCHVHLGAVYDSWETGPRAAAHAGLTTLLSFVEYDEQARETLPRAIKRLQEEASGAVSGGLRLPLHPEQSAVGSWTACPRPWPWA